MAKFRMVSERVISNARRLQVRGDGAIEMNLRATKLLFIAQATVEIRDNQGRFLNSHTSARDTITAPDGAQVIPYFKKNGQWFVVMVEQFRIAVPVQTLEAPGGEVDINDIPASMAKELAEEAHLIIDPVRIEVVLCELVQPSMLNGKAYGGIVEVAEAEVPEEVLGGEHQYNEYTALVIKPLVELLRLRDSSQHNLDLWGSRLLDEVAKKVGLLVKNY